VDIKGGGQKVQQQKETRTRQGLNEATKSDHKRDPELSRKVRDDCFPAVKRVAGRKEEAEDTAEDNWMLIRKSFECRAEVCRE
jgi:hypothetical protein